MRMFYLFILFSILIGKPVSALDSPDHKKTTANSSIINHQQVDLCHGQIKDGFWRQVESTKLAILKFCEFELKRTNLYGQRRLSAESYQKVTEYFENFEITLADVFSLVRLNPSLIELTTLTGQNQWSPEKRNDKLIAIASGFQHHKLTKQFGSNLTADPKSIFDFKHTVTYLMCFLKECRDLFSTKLSTPISSHMLLISYPAISIEEFKLIANFYDQLVLEVESLQQKTKGEKDATYKPPQTFSTGLLSLSNSKSVSAQTKASSRSGDLLVMPGIYSHNWVSNRVWGRV